MGSGEESDGSWFAVGLQPEALPWARIGKVCLLNLPLLRNILYSLCSVRAQVLVKKTVNLTAWNASKINLKDTRKSVSSSAAIARRGHAYFFLQQQHNFLIHA